MNEIWTPVVGFEQFYHISNFGKVMSIPNSTKFRKKESNVIKQQINFGYPVVTLSVFGNKKFKRVSRLVAEAFIENPKNKPCVNHKNGIKTDNRVENLEWCTYSENEQHSYSVLNKNVSGIKKTYKNGVNPKSKQVYCNEKKMIFNSIKDAAEHLGVHRANISAQIRGRLMQTGGLTFTFL